MLLFCSYFLEKLSKLSKFLKYPKVKSLFKPLILKHFNLICKNYLDYQNSQSIIGVVGVAGSNPVVPKFLFPTLPRFLREVNYFRICAFFVYAFFLLIFFRTGKYLI